jgi:hypothetical protein
LIFGWGNSTSAAPTINQYLEFISIDKSSLKDQMKADMLIRVVERLNGEFSPRTT